MLEGFQRKPFCTQDVVSERIPHQMVENYKVKPKEVTEKIKEEIATMRKIKAQSELLTPEKKSPHALSLAPPMVRVVRIIAGESDFRPFDGGTEIQGSREEPKGAIYNARTWHDVLQGVKRMRWI